MINLLIWGSGFFANTVFEAAERMLPSFRNNAHFSIKGIIDNNAEKWGQKFHGYDILSPGDALGYEFDYIVILMDNDWDVRIQAIYGYRIPKDKVKDKYFLLKELITLKYSNTEDPEIKRTLEYWETNDLSMFNQYLEKPNKKHEVIWDRKANMPYILFDDITGKQLKMYFPRNYQFEREEGFQYVSDLLWEQQPESPHLYTFKNHSIFEGDVIADGGVCEGNFALRYVNIASHIYLFEADTWWKEAHYYTFRDWENKISYYPKALSNRNGLNMITLDSVFGDNKRLDFLKMDIEGSEINALEEGEKTLIRENVRISACCYHKHEDEEKIKAILSKYGYRTEVSNGNVTFLWDSDIWWHLDFRKGIVYGDK